MTSADPPLHPGYPHPSIATAASGGEWEGAQFLLPPTQTTASHRGRPQ